MSRILLGAIPFALGLLIFSLGIVTLHITQQRVRDAGNAVFCRRCRYPLQDTSQGCSECGAGAPGNKPLVLVTARYLARRKLRTSMVLVIFGLSLALFGGVLVRAIA